VSIPAGHIITVGGLSVLDRLQDTGLQNPKVPVETVYETGNDLVVGKVLTEAAFSFAMTSWDVSCDLMAFLNGKHGKFGEGPSHGDAVGTTYGWDECQFVNLACPWARDTGDEGGNISSGVLVPSYYATALAYKFGVTANAEQTVTLDGGAYYLSDGHGGFAPATENTAYPIEEIATPTEKESEEAAGKLIVETKEKALVYRIGGHGSENYRHVFGVLVNGVIQQEGVDYIEEGGSAPGAANKKVKIKFLDFPETGLNVVKFMYFSDKPHAIEQAVHASTVTKPAAVRGRNIDILLGAAGETVLHGVQDFSLAASHKGTVQREMGYQDPIGWNETGIDCNGSITMDPKEEEALYNALAELTGIARSEVLGYINEYPVPITAVIYNPAKATEIIKSISITDAIFQAPGTMAKVNSTLSLPITWESLSGTFREIKGELP
jgi:hypothetical protein